MTDYQWAVYRGSPWDYGPGWTCYAGRASVRKTWGILHSLGIRLARTPAQQMNIEEKSNDSARRRTENK